jgi:hypothetical protein
LTAYPFAAFGGLATHEENFAQAFAIVLLVGLIVVICVVS